MKQKIIILLGLALAVITSCQNEDNIKEIDPIVEEATVPVNFSVGFKELIDNSTNYEPFTRAEGDNLPLTKILNDYTVFIIKDVDGRWIMDKKLDKKIKQGYDTHITITPENVNNVIQFETDLRPGTYRMVIFTGVRGLGKHGDLAPGMWVEDDNGKPKMAFTYAYQTPDYMNSGKRYIQEEVFAGWEPFKVEKTEDLHSDPLMENVHLTLERKVTKLRILLKYEKSEGGLNFFNQYTNGVIAQMNTTTGSHAFVDGLDIWGDPYYSDQPLTEMHYGAFYWNEPQTGSDGNQYLMPMKQDMRQHSIFYFSDPDHEVNVKVTNVEVSASSNLGINFVYACEEAESGIDTGDPFYITLKHNTVLGIMFMPGNNIWLDPRDSDNSNQVCDMFLDLQAPGIPKDNTGLFPLPYEFKDRY